MSPDDHFHLCAICKSGLVSNRVYPVGLGQHIEYYLRRLLNWSTKALLADTRAFKEVRVYPCLICLNEQENHARREY